MITYNKVYLFLVYLAIFFNLGFLNLFGQFEVLNMFLAVLISIFAFVVYLSQPNKKKIYEKWIYVFLILTYIVFLYHIYNFHKLNLTEMTFSSAFSNYDGVIILLLLFPIYELLCSNKKEKFIHGMIMLGFAALFLRLAIWILYNFTAFHPANYLIHAVTWRRTVLGHNFMRMSGTFLDVFLLIYSLNELLKNFHFKSKIKMKYLISVIFLFFYVIVVSQYRMILVAYTLILICMILIWSHNSKNKSLSVFLTALFIIILGVGNIDIIKEFINGFSVNSENGGSTAVRLDGIQYFWNLWQSTDKLNGLGFMTDNVQAGWNIYWFSDYGILASLFQFGFLGFFSYMIPFLAGLITTIKHFFSLSNIYVVGFTIYIISTIFTFDPMSNHFIALMPIYLALMLNSAYIRKCQYGKSKKFSFYNNTSI